MKAIVEASPNIALIKYWGKKPSTTDQDRNTPLNPSISFTLSAAKTRVEIEDAEEFSVEINDQPANPTDQEKVSRHFSRVHEALLERKLIDRRPPRPARLRSKNNFPSGTGMASSASSFAALTLAMIAHELGVSECQRRLATDPGWISALARRGSGSAARSVFAPWALWDGLEAKPIDSSWKLFDTVVIFSKQTKKYPSSLGHEACLSSPLMPDRQRLLPARIRGTLDAISKKSLTELGPLIEEEALEMHAVAGAGNPAINYLSDSSRKLIEALRKMPKRGFYFTADAGPNIHLISERPIHGDVKQLLQDNDLEAEIWQDCAGSGPSIR